MFQTIMHVMILFVLLIFPDSTISFCNDGKLYACKEGGITKCVPKTDRCDEDCSMNPFPIEKPSCKVGCTPHHKWCEQRGKCVSNKEKCDCGPDKIYCTSKATYSCENRHGLHESPIFNICPDGSCMGVKHEDGCKREDGCKQGEFKCGDQCKENKEITNFRNCDGKCISASDLCYVHEPSTLIKTLSYVLAIFLAFVVLPVCCICIFIKLKQDDISKLRTLSRLEDELKNMKKVIDVDKTKYEELLEKIISEKKLIKMNLLRLPKQLQRHDVELELLPKQDVRELEDEVRKLRSGGKINRWLCEGDKNQGLYCSICVIAGVTNECTIYPGIDPTTSNKEEHLSGSIQSSKLVLTNERQLKQTQEFSNYPDTSSSVEFSKPKLSAKNDQNSHPSAVKIIEDVQKYANAVIQTQEMFSLILYEKNKVLSVILKVGEVTDIAERSTAIRDIYIPIGLLLIEQNSKTLTLTKEVQKILETQNIHMSQITSISSVHVDGILPPTSTEVCQQFCKIQGTGCIFLLSIIKTQPAVVDLEQIQFEEEFLLLNLQKNLNSLASYFIPLTQGYDIFRRIQGENREELFRQESLESIITFAATYPNEIREVLLEIQRSTENFNETNENKQKISRLIDNMDQFLTKATLFLYNIVLDAYGEIFPLLEDPYPKWYQISEAVKKQEKQLTKLLDTADSIMNKFSKLVEKTDAKQGQLCLLIKNALRDMESTEVNLFNEFKNKFIHNVITNLQLSFPTESLKVMNSISKLLNTKEYTSTYQECMGILRKTFALISTNNFKSADLNKIKQACKNMNLKEFSAHLITKHAKEFPSVSYLANIYLNLSLKSFQLQPLFSDIDTVINFATPNLSLEEKNMKLLILTVGKSMQNIEKEKGNISSTRNNVKLDKGIEDSEAKRREGRIKKEREILKETTTKENYMNQENRDIDKVIPTCEQETNKNSASNYYEAEQSLVKLEEANSNDPMPKKQIDQSSNGNKHNPDLNDAAPPICEKSPDIPSEGEHRMTWRNKEQTMKNYMARRKDQLQNVSTSVKARIEGKKEVLDTNKHDILEASEIDNNIDRDNEKDSVELGAIGDEKEKRDKLDVYNNEENNMENGEAIRLEAASVSQITALDVNRLSNDETIC